MEMYVTFKYKKKEGVRQWCELYAIDCIRLGEWFIAQMLPFELCILWNLMQFCWIGMCTICLDSFARGCYNSIILLVFKFFIYFFFRFFKNNILNFKLFFLWN